MVDTFFGRSLLILRNNKNHSFDMSEINELKIGNPANGKLHYLSMRI